MTEIRATHRYAFRCDEWATLLGTVDHTAGHRCYVVRFPDGTSDFWPINDKGAAYEFRAEASA